MQYWFLVIKKIFRNLFERQSCKIPASFNIIFERRLGLLREKKCLQLLHSIATAIPVPFFFFFLKLVKAYAICNPLTCFWHPITSVVEILKVFLYYLSLPSGSFSYRSAISFSGRLKFCTGERVKLLRWLVASMVGIRRLTWIHNHLPASQNQVDRG